MEELTKLIENVLQEPIDIYANPTHLPRAIAKDYEKLWTPDRMRRVDNAEKAREEGVAIAREMVTRVRGMVQGVQLSAPFGRYQMALDVAEAIGER